MFAIPLINVWDEAELIDKQVDAVSRFMQCDTTTAVEASIEFARYLNGIGLSSDNYPIFLELLRNENHHVIEALLGDSDAFDLFTKVEPNPYIISFCFEMLQSYAPGGVYEKTLAIIFGILYRAYHSAKEGTALFSLTIEHVNAVGKFLDKSKPQNDPTNRYVLDVLGDIADYESIQNERPDVDEVASHANALRNAFFDRRVSMESVLPGELLIKEDYRASSVNPRETKKIQSA